MDNWTDYSNTREKLQTSTRVLPPLQPLQRMTEDRLYRWADFRIMLNSDFCKDIITRETNRMPPLYRFRDIDNLISKFMADPVVAKVGGALRTTYCKTHDALRGNAYFIFGIPRVRRLNTETYSCYDIPSKVEHSENRDIESRITESSDEQSNVRNYAPFPGREIDNNFSSVPSVRRPDDLPTTNFAMRSFIVPQTTPWDGSETR